MTERTPSTRAGQRLLGSLSYGQGESLTETTVEWVAREIAEVEAEARADALREVGEAATALIDWLNTGHDHPDSDYNCGSFAWDELCGVAQDRERELIRNLRAALSQPPAPDPSHD